MASLRTKLLLGYGGMLVISIAAFVAILLHLRGLTAVLIVAQQLFAGLFLLLVGRLIIGPLKALTRGTQQLQAGDRGLALPAQPEVSMFPDSRKDEVGELARSISAMASTEREQLLSEHDQRVRAQETARCVISSLPHAVALVSPAGRIEIVNAAAAHFGLAVGQDVHACPMQWLPALVEQVLATGSPAGSGLHGVQDAHRESFVQKFENGRELFFLPQVHPVLDNHGSIIGISLVLLDVTEQRHVEEARQGLLSSVSHQLKTPMTSIQMSIHLLLEDAVDRLTPRQAELLKAARDDADRLHQQIEELLASAREKR